MLLVACDREASKALACSIGALNQPQLLFGFLVHGAVLPAATSLQDWSAVVSEKGEGSFS
nr:hypothetical protein [uncultured Cohaesibacter sp.]